MPTVQEDRAMRDANRTLQDQGLEGNFYSTLNEKRQWWKPDGTPLPTLLPVDDYNRRVFMARGWTLSPPRAGIAPAPIAPGMSPIEQEIQHAKAKAAAKTVGAPSPITREVEREIAAKVRDAVPVAAVTGQTVGTESAFNFIPPVMAPPIPMVEVKKTHARDGDGVCVCGWSSLAAKKEGRKVSLDRHLKEKI
jgi:hypothetical protein